MNCECSLTSLRFPNAGVSGYKPFLIDAGHLSCTSACIRIHQIFDRTEGTEVLKVYLTTLLVVSEIEFEGNQSFSL